MRQFKHAKPSIIERQRSTLYSFADPDRAQEVAAALEDTESAIKDKRLTLIRDYPIKGRKAYQLKLGDGSSAFVKVDDLTVRTRIDRRILSRHSFMDEADIMLEANRAGIKTPPLIAVGASPAGLFRKSAFLATEWAENYGLLDLTLDIHCKSEPETVPDQLKDELPQTLAQLFASLHEKGFIHRDIQGSHMLWRIKNGEIDWAFVDLEGATFKKPLPLWYRIKTLYMAGRHILKDKPPEASMVFLRDYFKLAFPNAPAEGLIEKTLRYASFREEGRELQAGKFSPAAYIKFAWKHRGIPLMKY